MSSSLQTLVEQALRTGAAGNVAAVVDGGAEDVAADYDPEDGVVYEIDHGEDDHQGLENS
uniref:Uncharacterized protein n=1 Tax=Arion vulgaris TaxID=1028688 RepID=A0A0B6YWR4_9EUPU